MEQRLNFSDYSAEEQERDIEKFKRLEKESLEKNNQHIFLLRVNGIWAHMSFYDGLKYKFYDGKNLIDTWKEIVKTNPNCRIKFIMNEGLENYLRDVRKKQMLVKQLEINFR